MSGTKQRLELTWIGKNDRPKLEPRILLEEGSKSYARPVGAKDIFDNRLIYGDNLLALKALETEFSGLVKCIYIDPPYNTGAAFIHYDDGIEHSIWLSLMRDRLEILARLLHPTDGSLWVSIDDYEAPYLRVLLDEIMGRRNFIASNVWQKRYSRENREAIGDVHEYILVYAADPIRFKEVRNKVPPTPEQTKVYRNPNKDPKGPWRPIPMTAQEGHATKEQFYEIVSPSGVVFDLPPGGVGDLAGQRSKTYVKRGESILARTGDSQPNVIRYLSEVDGYVPWTWWSHDEVGHTDELKKEIHALFGKVDAFDTPKPERLMKRIIEIATDAGDLVLDSFAGSGTTGAVAHKMGRRWIMVEVKNHCDTLIATRLQKVINGEDRGGVTEAVQWQGGGGFRYFRLAPSLLKKDRWGNWVIADTYNAAMLAEAMCKHMGFTYAPSQDPAEYWRHGHSSERDFIFVTTANVTHDKLRAISEDVGPERTLLVCCKAFNARADVFENLTVKKIPQAVLFRCEWGRDDYSLRIAEAPPPPEDTAPPATTEAAPPKRGRRAATASTEPSLFSAMDVKGAGK